VGISVAEVERGWWCGLFVFYKFTIFQLVESIGLNFLAVDLCCFDPFYIWELYI
jgi:hypothetical protein